MRREIDYSLAKESRKLTGTLSPSLGRVYSCSLSSATSSLAPSAMFYGYLQSSYLLAWQDISELDLELLR